MDKETPQDFEGKEFVKIVDTHDMDYVFDYFLKGYPDCPEEFTKKDIWINVYKNKVIVEVEGYKEKKEDV